MFTPHSSFLLGVCVVVAGCQGPMKREVTSLTLDTGIVGASETLRTSTHDAYGKTEVLSAGGSRGWMSVAFISTNTMGVIAESGEAPRLFLKGWKALNGKPLAYGETAKADTANGAITYQRFSFAGNNCFHFHKLKHHSQADDWGRYRQLLAGYVCRSGGGKIPKEAVSSFLKGIVIPHVDVFVYEKDALPVTLLDPVRPLRTRLFIEPRDPPG